jgi:hypothetical protein
MTSYMVLVKRVALDNANRDVAVGPFKAQHLAFEWGDEYVKRHEFVTVPVVSRADAVLAMARPRVRS